MKRMWYPTEEFVIKTHETMIAKFGGYKGFERGVPVLRHLLSEVKETDGVHRKAAILLRGIAIGRIFQDGNHRTAYTVTKTFLEMNGARMKVENIQEIIKFIKAVWHYNVDQIEAWLKDGKET